MLMIMIDVGIRMVKAFAYLSEEVCGVKNVKFFKSYANNYI